MSQVERRLSHNAHLVRDMPLAAQIPANRATGCLPMFGSVARSVAADQREIWATAAFALSMSGASIWR